MGEGGAGEVGGTGAAVVTTRVHALNSPRLWHATQQNTWHATQQNTEPRHNTSQPTAAFTAAHVPNHVLRGEAELEGRRAVEGGDAELRHFHVVERHRVVGRHHHPGRRHQHVHEHDVRRDVCTTCWLPRRTQQGDGRARHLGHGECRRR